MFLAEFIFFFFFFCFIFKNIPSRLFKYFESSDVIVVKNKNLLALLAKKV